MKRARVSESGAATARRVHPALQPLPPQSAADGLDLLERERIVLAVPNMRMVLGAAELSSNGTLLITNE